MTVRGYGSNRTPYMLRFSIRIKCLQFIIPSQVSQRAGKGTKGLKSGSVWSSSKSLSPVVSSCIRGEATLRLSPRLRRFRALRLAGMQGLLGLILVLPFFRKKVVGVLAAFGTNVTTCVNFEPSVHQLLDWCPFKHPIYLIFTSLSVTPPYPKTTQLQVHVSASWATPEHWSRSTSTSTNTTRAS